MEIFHYWFIKFSPLFLVNQIRKLLLNRNLKITLSICCDTLMRYYNDNEMAEIGVFSSTNDQRIQDCSMTHKLFKLELNVTVFKLYLLSSQLLSIIKAQKLNHLFLWLQINFLVCYFQKHIANSIEINFLQNYQLNIKHSKNFFKRQNFSNISSQRAWPENSFEITNK